MIALWLYLSVQSFRMPLNYVNEKVILITALEEGKEEDKLVKFSEWELGSEEKVIKAFYDYFKDKVYKLRSERLEEIVGKGKSERLFITGYNVLVYDIPLLIQKGVEYKVDSIGSLNELWYSNYILDLYQVMIHVNRMKFSGLKLGEIKKRFSLELPALKGSGSKVPKYYKKKDYGKIEEYAISKLNLLKELRKRLYKNPYLGVREP